MAFAGSFTADGQGNLTNGISDINTVTEVTTSQAFTGTYNVGADNRGTMTITPAVGTPQTFRFALGAFNSSSVATKARFIEFDQSGQTGSGVIEMQDTNAFLTAALSGNFAFGASGENISANHFGGAGRFTLDGVGGVTSGLEDTDTSGVVSSLVFAGTYSVAASGRGAFAITFVGTPGPTNFVVYVVSANETFFISVDPRSATVAR